MPSAADFPAPRADEGQFYWRFDPVGCAYIVFQRGSRYSLVAGKWARVAEALSRFLSGFPQHRDAIAAGFAQTLPRLSAELIAETAAWRAIHLAAYDPFVHGFDAAGHPCVQFDTARAAA